MQSLLPTIVLSQWQLHFILNIIRYHRTMTFYIVLVYAGDSLGRSHVEKCKLTLCPCLEDFMCACVI